MQLDTGEPSPGFVASLIDLLRRRWRVGAGVFALVLAGVLGVVFLTHPVYRAETRLRLGEPPPMGGVSPNASILGFLQLGGDPFSNDLELLASRTLAEGVVRDAALNASVLAPRGWHRDSLFTEFSAASDTRKATFRLRWQRDGRVRVERTAPTDSLVGTFAPGDPAEFGGVRVRPRAWRSGAPRSVEVSTRPFSEVVRLTREQLELERARRDANVVEISFSGTDPAVAEAVVASAVERFVQLRTALQRRESGQTVDSLRAVANQTLADLGRAESVMEDMQRSTRLIAPDAQSEAFIERYSEAVGELETARAEFTAISTVLQRVGDAADPASAWTGLAAYPAFLQNATIGELLGALTALDEKRAELASRRTVENRELRVLTEQIRQRDASLRAIAQGYRTALGERIGLLEAQVASMESALERVPAQTMELGRRHRDVRILSEVLVLTEQRLRQEELRQALTFANVQVIDPPALLFKPVWPRKLLGLGVGFLLASVFGLMAVVVVERADRTVRRASEVRELIGAPVLTVAARGRAGALSLPAEEAGAVLRLAARDGPGPRRLSVVPVGEADLAEEIARALRQGLAPPEGATERCLEIRATPPVASFASAALAGGAPIVLALSCRRTTRDDLLHSVSLLRENGGSIAGAVLVCDREAEVNATWR